MTSSIGWVTYTDDDNNNLSIKLSADAAQAQGLTINPTGATGSSWPYGKHNLRHITGKTNDSPPRYGRLVICSVLNGLYQGSILSWVMASTSRTYHVLGKFGERKPLNEVA